LGVHPEAERMGSARSGVAQSLPPELLDRLRSLVMAYPAVAATIVVALLATAIGLYVLRRFERPMGTRFLENLKELDEVADRDYFKRKYQEEMGKNVAERKKVKEETELGKFDEVMEAIEEGDPGSLSDAIDERDVSGGASADD